VARTGAGALALGPKRKCAGSDGVSQPDDDASGDGEDEVEEGDDAAAAAAAAAT
jgi:hypothetical protein